MLIGILQNEDPQSSIKWQLACKKAGIPYVVIDLTSNIWIDLINSNPVDFYLLKPPGLIERFKNLYDERVYIITNILKKRTYPSFDEIVIYENKRMLTYFLQSTNTPHAKTHIFYNKEEAINFLTTSEYPVVGKSSIGASGSGVVILNDIKQAVKYSIEAFSNKGLKRRFGPNRVTGNPAKWISKAIKSPQYFAKKISEYFSIYNDGQRGFIILQEYISHEFEWRVVKIGESYFAHKKVKYKNKASGSKGIDYVNPPFRLLNFVRELCDKYNFDFMAVDLFERTDGVYLVNELQTIFGHVQNFIMSVDGVPGRYIYENNQWGFESGDFNTNESYDLRLKTAIELHERSKKGFNSGSC